MSDIIPVFLGADLNCYNFARAFHEAYGVESYAYGRYPMAPTKYSKIIHFTTVPDMDNEDTMLRILHELRHSIRASGSICSAAPTITPR